MSSHILVIDDEEGIRLSLRGILEDEGFTVSLAESAEEGLAFFEKNSADLILLDIWMPGMDGLELLEKLHTDFSDLPVLMISGHGTIETAVMAIKKGATDFIEKPLSIDKVLLAVERALQFGSLKKENTRLKAQLKNTGSNQIMGSSPAILTLKEQISRVAPLDTWVLITGENGTGKELVARAIHEGSKRSEKPLVALNCAAIPEELIESELFGHEKGAFTGADSAKIGKFELAFQGTLFLDEIADMSLKTQAKILRILQEKTYERVGGNKTYHADVRVIAATNKDLEAAIADGSFREDLYYRLRVFPISVPPLRNREKDILLLAEYFSSTIALELGLSPVLFDKKAVNVMLAYGWPGNVRELRNFIERMIILYAGKTVGESDLPIELVSLAQKNLSHGKLENKAGTDNDGQDDHSDIQSETDASKSDSLLQFALKTEELPSDFKLARNVFESQFLASKLAECDGNVSRLAEAIGLERSHLHRKLKLYNIQGGNS